MGTPLRPSRQETSWMLYDVGNSAFVLIIITAVMPLFFKQVASRGMADALSTSNWGVANAAASLALALSAPLLGTFADYRGAKKKFFLAFLALGIGATFLLSTVQPGGWLWCLAVFALAKFGFAGANIFYDAFLPDVTGPQRMDRISSAGFALGYLGSVVPFLLVLALLHYGMQRSGSSTLPLFQARLGFWVVGLWWLLFSLPLIKNVHQTHFVPASARPVRDSFTRFLGTFREIRRYREAFLFLVAYFFYIDGVDTVITMSTAYGVDIGLDATLLILAILMIQLVSFPFALLYGRLAERFSARRMLLAGICIFAVITFLAFFIPLLATPGQRMLAFWLLAFLVATSLGGVQALSRSYFARLIPPERSGEFFGFYNIFGRLATIMGPFLMGIVARFTGHSRYGLLSVVLLLVIGGILLLRVQPEGSGLGPADA